MYTYVASNYFENFEGWFDIFDEPTSHGDFYTVGSRVFKDEMIRKSQDWDPEAVYWNNLIPEGQVIVHEHHVYNLLQMIGDLGGVKEIIVSIIGFFIMPLSTFAFQLKAFERLYFARTHSGKQIF